MVEGVGSSHRRTGREHFSAADFSTCAFRGEQSVHLLGFWGKSHIVFLFPLLFLTASVGDGLCHF